METITPSKPKNLKPEDWPTQEHSGEDVEASGLFSSESKKNQIHFKVDNQTPYSLTGRSETYAYWGDFDSSPTTVSPYTVSDAGHLVSSSSPFVGSLGIIGFTITGSQNTVYAILLGSNPYFSARDNWAYAQLLGNQPNIDKDSLNALYDAETQSGTIALDGKTLTVAGSIGQADNATATFKFTWA